VLGVISLTASPGSTQSGLASRDITINLAGLITHGSTFYLHFSFLDGSGQRLGNGNNSVVIGNFAMDGGDITGPPEMKGGVTGDTKSQISMNDTAFINEFIQPTIECKRLLTRSLYSEPASVRN